MGALAGHFEAGAHRPTPLYRLDARVKLLLLAFYTVAVVTTPLPHWPVFALYAALLAVAARAARLQPRHLCLRMGIVLPFLLMAAVFLPFQPAGFAVFLNFAIKSLLGAGAAIVVTESTPFPHLATALERLRVPRVAVMIFSFTHRYLFVLVEEARRMMRARDSRCYRGRWLADVPVIGQMIGTLFLRSYERGERVYLAMLSRCFEGETDAREVSPPLTPRDLGWLTGTSLLLAGAWTAARLY